MRKTKSFAIAAALILAGVAGWAAMTTQARVATPTGVTIDPTQITMNAAPLSEEHYVDYSLVFN